METNWKPLETRRGAVRCAGFMFMGRSNGINQKCGAAHFWFNVKLPAMWS
jgi:hypothetical protein